jgi:hypothetical protein
MLLLVYTLVKAPDVTGARGARSPGSGAAASDRLRRQRDSVNPLVRCDPRRELPPTPPVDRVGGFSRCFFLTLYMQIVLHYSPIQTGVADSRRAAYHRGRHLVAALCRIDGRSWCWHRDRSGGLYRLAGFYRQHLPL